MLMHSGESQREVQGFRYYRATVAWEIESFCEQEFAWIGTCATSIWLRLAETVEPIYGQFD